MPVFRFILYRLLQMVVVLLGAITILFVVLYLLVPGDAAQVSLGNHASAESVESLRNHLGLDQPLWKQYGLYLWRVIHLDLGTSYDLNRSVTDVIADYLPATAYLAGGALLLETVFGIGWGMHLTMNRSSGLKSVSTITSAILLSVPVFFLGIVLQYIFASKLHLLPISGLGGWSPLNLVLPALSLAAAQSVVIAAVMKSSLTDEMRKPYILAARSRGLSRSQAMRSHAMRNALGPVVTILGIDLGVLLGGALITEIV
ncbi:MAG: ABC transporter permease, partial [Thermoleophilia bacterium]